MRRILPSPLWFRSAIVLVWGMISAVLACAQDPAPDAPVVELIKQLVFIEQIEYSEGVIDGIKQPYDVKVAPDGGHVYVASQWNDAISYFARDEENGELVYVDFVTQADMGENALDGARALVLSPDGEFVYSIAMFSDSLATFNRDKTSGALTFLDAIYDSDGGVDGLEGPRSIVMSPDGKNLYVAAFDDSKISVYSRDSVTGEASFLGVYKEGDQGVEELSQPHAIVLSPDGKNLYVGLYGHEIIVFDRNAANGLLAYKNRVPFLVGQSETSAPALALSPDGKSLYVASLNDDAISVFSRNTETGVIELSKDVFNNSGGVSDLDGPHAISISSDGAYVYIATAGSHSVTTFERNSKTGALSYYQSLVAGAEDEWSMRSPISIGTSPDGEHVYLGSASGTHSIYTFRREVLVDPPEFVVQPIDQSIEEGQTVAFYALAQGVDLSYQWLRDGTEVVGETLPVLTLPSVGQSDDGSAFSIRVSNPGGILTSQAVDLSVLPPVVVNAPADLTALDISSSSAQLAWKDLSDNETSFEVQRRTLGGAFSGLVTVFENQIQYEDTSLESSTTYIYRVRARQGVNVSLWSNDAVIESFDDTPNSPVDLTVVEQSYNRVSLRWSDRSAVEDGFRVLRRLDQLGSLWTSVATLDKNVTAYVDRSVSPLSNYAYRVQAFNESGNSDYSNSVVALTSEIPVESISPEIRTIPQDATSGYSIGVTSSKEWEAISEVAWLIVTSPTNGQGTGNQGVTYRSLLNESQNERIGKIIVGGLEHTVTQEGSPPFMRISPARTEVVAAGGAKTVSISSNVEWTASEDSDWVSISSGASGSDYGSVKLSIEANDSFEVREASLTITSELGDETQIIEQAGKTPQLDLSSAKTRFDESGGSGSVTIDSNLDWSASVDVSVSWITLTDTVSGNGNGAVAFSVAPNDTFAIRTADIFVNESAVSITQDPPAGDPPFIEVSPSPADASAAGGSVTVDLESNVEWTASESVDWVTITAGDSGTDNGSVVLDFDPNDSTAPREMVLNVISVSGGVDPQEHTIVQAGKIPYLSIDSASTDFTREGGTGSVSVDANQDWSARVSASWISLTGAISGSGDGMIAFSVDEYYSPDVRSATIIVNDQVVTITQDPPFESDVIEPEWLPVAVGPLGAQLDWKDLSDDEIGFRIRRSVVGADRVFDVVELPADATSYFDRDAPRGKQVEYTLVAYDAIGESKEVKTTSELIPSANFTSVASHVEASLDTRVFEAKIPLAGDGEVVVQRSSTSERFSALSFGSRYPVSRYRLDSDAGMIELLGESDSIDVNTYFSMDEAVGGSGLDLSREHLTYSARSLDVGSAFPRGARAMGQLLEFGSKIVVGFEIVGDIELPVLLQAVGDSIDSGYVAERASGLKLELFEIQDVDTLQLLESNTDWNAWVNASTIEIEDAISKTGAVSTLSADGGEARMLLMLGEGRYVAVLSSATGSVGTAMLEVYDAR